MWPPDLLPSALNPELAARLVSLERLEAGAGTRATGIGALDELLRGGWPRGALSEIAGPRSSGRTAVVLRALATAGAAGEATALVDVGGGAAIATRGGGVRRPAPRPALDPVRRRAAGAEGGRSGGGGGRVRGGGARSRRRAAPDPRRGLAAPAARGAQPGDDGAGRQQHPHGWARSPPRRSSSATARRASSPTGRRCSTGLERAGACARARAARSVRREPERKLSMRLACVYVPQLALQAVLRRCPEARDEPAALLDAAAREKAARDASWKREARRAGVRPGMTAAQARRSAPASGSSPRRRPIARRARRRWPTSGSRSRRAWTQRRWRAHLLRRLRSRPALPARRDRDRAGGAGARRAPGAGGAGRDRGVEGGGARRDARARAGGGAGGARAGARAFLAPLPVELFTDDDELRAAFRRWGTRTAGAIAALPPTAVASAPRPAPAPRWRGSRARQGRRAVRAAAAARRARGGGRARLPDLRDRAAHLRAARPRRSRARRGWRPAASPAPG